MEVTVTLRHFRISPDKVRLVVDLIRGKDVSEADVILTHTQKGSSGALRKLLKQGLADAEHNYKLDPKDMQVKEIRVDSGVTMKRYRPRAFGRAAQIRKKASHVTLVLAEKTKKQDSGKDKK